MALNSLVLVLQLRGELAIGFILGDGFTVGVRVELTHHPLELNTEVLVHSHWLLDARNGS